MAVFVVCALLAGGRATRGQTTGSISGRVADPAGTPLPGVTVEATSTSLQGTRTAVTDRNGAFRFPAVPPGAYRVQATLSGFRTVEKDGDRFARHDGDGGPDIAARDGRAGRRHRRGASRGHHVDDDRNELHQRRHQPPPRRRATTPTSCARTPASSGPRTRRRAARSRSPIYGSTSVENQWIIDGVNTTNVLKGMQGKAINNEFVQEVEVKTGGYQAEYGRALGGVINVITKSGGNEFHGDGFVYYDSNALQAERSLRATGVDSDLTGMRIVDLLTDGLRRRSRRVHREGPPLVLRRLRPGERSGRALALRLERSSCSTRCSFRSTSTDNLYSGKLTWNIAASSTLIGSVFADPTANTGASRRRSAPGSAGRSPTRPRGPGSRPATFGGTDFGLRLNQLLGSSGAPDAAGRASSGQVRASCRGPGPGGSPRGLHLRGGNPRRALRLPGRGELRRGRTRLHLWT